MKAFKVQNERTGISTTQTTKKGRKRYSMHDQSQSTPVGTPSAGTKLIIQEGSVFQPSSRAHKSPRRRRPPESCACENRPDRRSPDAARRGEQGSVQGRSSDQSSTSLGLCFRFASLLRLLLLSVSLSLSHSPSPPLSVFLLYLFFFVFLLSSSLLDSSRLSYSTTVPID